MPPPEWREIEEAFGAALEVPVESRSEWLDERCGADPELRREVESLLSAESASDGFLRHDDLAGVAGSLLGDDAEEITPGRRVGAYTLLRELGRGGMGVVYLAAREGGEFTQRVALKLVRRGLDTEDILERFRTERRILASLNHPNIARLFDGGTTEEGLPFFVMEYVEGLPLLRYCDGRALSTGERLRLFREVCAAVQYAHQNLVIHRDIKPSNILVTSAGEVKLLDFGVAKLLSPEPGGEGAAQTQTALRVMTPEYASPEQVRGERLTTATDVYSLGVVLYEMLTGAKPYRLKDASPEELSRAIRDTEPSKPSEAFRDAATRGRAAAGKSDSLPNVAAFQRPRVAASQLRGDIDNIVLMALRKEPSRRYKSVAQFSEDIERHLNGLPVVARKDTFAYRASKFVRRHRAGVAAAALVALAIVAGLVGTVWEARAAARERDQARREQAKAEQLNKFLQSILSAASPEEKGKDAKVIEVLNDAARRVETEFAAEPALKAQALLTIGQTYVMLELLDEAEKALREALKVNAELYGEENRATTSSMTYLAEVVLAKGEYGEAESLLVRAVAAQRRLSPSGSKELAYALHVLGELYARKGEYEKAKLLLRESVAMSDKISGGQNENSAYTLVSLGRAEQFSGDTAGAESTYRKSVAIYRGLPPRYEGKLGAALVNLGGLLAARGDYDEGVGVMREAEGIFQKQGAGYSLFVTESYLCNAYANHGDYGRALEACVKAVEGGRKLGIENTADFITALDYLGLSLTRAGRAQEAERALRESLDRAKKVLPPADVRTSLIEGALGECLSAQGRFAEAEPLITHSYDAVRASRGEKSPLAAHAAKRAAEFYDRWKKPDLAAKFRAATTPS
jgi:serine/threonine-protein kinase